MCQKKKKKKEKQLFKCIDRYENVMWKQNEKSKQSKNNQPSN